MRHFGHKQKQMLPHRASQSPAVTAREVSKGVAQVVVDHLAADSQDVSEQNGQSDGGPLASFDPKRLKNADQHPDNEIFAQVL